jgi:histone H3/H4
MATLPVQKNCIPKSVFRRIVKDQLRYSHPFMEECDGYMITKDGLARLQQAVEEYAVEVFGGAVQEASNNKRVTIRADDLEAVGNKWKEAEPNTIRAYTAEMDDRLHGMVAEFDEAGDESGDEEGEPQVFSV